MKHLLKVLNKDLISPLKKFKFKQNKEYHCNNFDDNKNIDCSTGFHAVNWDGIWYAFSQEKVIYHCTVWGKEVEFDKNKRRYEYFKLGKEVTKKDLLNAGKKEGYKIYEVMNPTNPLKKLIKPTKKDIALLKKWDSDEALFYFY